MHEGSPDLAVLPQRGTASPSPVCCRRLARACCWPFGRAELQSALVGTTQAFFKLDAAGSCKYWATGKSLREPRLGDLSARTASVVAVQPHRQI